MKKAFFSLLLTMWCVVAGAQDGQTVFNFLCLPQSAHAAALGGDNITAIEDDASLAFHNPALLYSAAGNTINLNYMNYMQGSHVASAQYNRLFGKHGAGSVSAQYVDYGTMKETTADNIQTGEFHARDIALSATYSHELARNVAGGISARLISSSIGGYNSLGVCVDLGVNWFLPESEWSFSGVIKNLGGQVKAYNEDFEKIPLDVQIGVAKRLGTSPITVHLTAVELNNWDLNTMDHLVAGLNLDLGDQIYLAAGYNFRRAEAMKITSMQDYEETTSSHMAGLTLGGGLQLDRFKLQVAWGKYHVSSSSLNFSVSYNL